MGITLDDWRAALAGWPDEDLPGKVPMIADWLEGEGYGPQAGRLRSMKPPQVVGMDDHAPERGRIGLVCGGLVQDMGLGIRRPIVELICSHGRRPDYLTRSRSGYVVLPSLIRVTLSLRTYAYQDRRGLRETWDVWIGACQECQRAFWILSRREAAPPRLVAAVAGAVAMDVYRREALAVLAVL